MILLAGLCVGGLGRAVLLVRLGAVHQFPNLCRWRHSGKGFGSKSSFFGPPRCSTPVPQPLSVMNSVKAKLLRGGSK